MERILLKPLRDCLQGELKGELAAENLQLAAENAGEQADFMAELRLLKNVPFACLVPEAKLLPPESIRFFWLDESWLNAMIDGAISLGRLTEYEALADRLYISQVVGLARENLALPRFKLMHPNHRRGDKAPAAGENAKTGFLLRSGLVSKWQGLETFGYSGDKQLNILRMESLAPDILICIFDGVLTRFVISQPKMSLRFGCPDQSGQITLRSMEEGQNFGEPLPDKKVNLADFTESNGRIKAAQLAAQMEKLLAKPVKSSELAFQLIAVAKRAEFWKVGE